MDTAELKAVIAVREAEIDRLRKLNGIDKNEVCRRESAAAIKAHGITRDKVFTTDGDGKPWFGYIKLYREWIAAQEPRLPWAEWSGTVYPTDSILDGHMPDSPMRYSDIPNTTPTEDGDA